ncbi:MAG: hypothetical protein ACP5O8_03770 [Candidatus Aenigmatarchaeota archaeon]
MKKKSIESKVVIWKAATEKLEKPRRRKVEASLADIQRNASEGDTILVPGMALAVV